jgi:hypothetical protein
MARRSIFKTVRKTLKLLFLLLIIATFAALIWRMGLSNAPKSMKKLSANEALSLAYEKSEGELSAFTQKHITITKDKKCYGYFAVNSVVFIPEANQVQVVIRYNNSTIKHLKEDYGVDPLPDRSLEVYDFSLVVSTFADETKDEKNVTKQRIHPTSITTEENALYNFRKVIFDGVSMGEDVCNICLDFYYVGAIDYSVDAYGTLLVYDYITPRDEYSLSRKEKKSLK